MSYSLGLNDITDETLSSWKQSFAKDGIVYETDDAYREAIVNLVSYIELLMEIERSQITSPIDGKAEYKLTDKDGNSIIL